MRALFQFLLGCITFWNQPLWVSGDDFRDAIQQLRRVEPSVAKTIKFPCGSAQAEITACFERAEYSSLVDPDVLRGASEEEAEQLRESLEEDRREPERRTWVKAMLLNGGA